MALLVAPLLGAAPAAACPTDPVGGGPGGGAADGWASLNGGTTGGAAAPQGSVTVVHDRAQLIAALDNGGDRSGPKVVRVAGTINGNETADGRLLGEQDYAPGYDLDLYMACFVDGTTWSDSAQPWCRTSRNLRASGSNAEKAQIQIDVPSNTTLVGLGRDARLNGVYLSIRASTNIIVRNLTLEAPVDYFTSWSPGDGALGAWNARFDALSVVTGTNLWVDHCTFTDGRFPDSQAPIGFHNQHVQRHDGLLDMEDGTDFVTVSASRFLDHDKALLIGSGDSRADRDRGHLRMTFHDNLFQNTTQRSPRLRFGQVHTYNNVFVGSTKDPDYPMISEALGGHHYFLGMGLESKFFSEYNVFVYDAAVDPADITVTNFKGNQFVDHGSWLNGRPVNINAVAERKFLAARATALPAAQAAGTTPPEWALTEFTTNVGWQPAEAYHYRALRSAHAVSSEVYRHAGAGRP